MKKPRIMDFDPDAKSPTLKSSLDNMPVIERTRPTSEAGLEADKVGGTPVPPAVPRTVPRTGRLVPKAHRPIRQRQPFDIYEDQYVTLKKISEEERGFINGRGMSQMVREAIDNYLRDKKTAN